jgi:hypothetical protein
MDGEFPADYLAQLPDEQHRVLARVNRPGLSALADYLASGEAIAFLGAGASAPLYPLWDELIGDLVDAAADRLDRQSAAACRALAGESPEEVVEILRRRFGSVGYREVLRQVLRVRTDMESGRSWTAVHELVCRCAFKGVVTNELRPWHCGRADAGAGRGLWNGFHHLGRRIGPGPMAHRGRVRRLTASGAIRPWSAQSPGQRRARHHGISAGI